jgi:hypothetical protein
MLSSLPTEPSPLSLAAVYLTGILLGHLLLMPTEDLRRVWQTIRSTWSRRPD